MESRIRLERDFLPEHTFDCGQCFRWNKEEDGSFTGVAHKKAVNISYDNKDILIKGASEEDIKEIWREYLDYSGICSFEEGKCPCDEGYECTRCLDDDVYRNFLVFKKKRNLK